MNTKETKKKEEFKLPRYLRLEKGSMWFDIDGENCSGVKLYATKNNLIGRQTILDTVYDQVAKENKYVARVTDIPNDINNNKNILDYGKVPEELVWYVDTTKIEPIKLSRILLAYKHGILVEADPKNPPTIKIINDKLEFTHDKRGDRIFSGKNKEMYQKLQNNSFKVLRDFVNSTPKNELGKQNLIDLLDYERKGYNSLSRPRLEVLDLLRSKLNEFGNGISPIRVNED